MGLKSQKEIYDWIWSQHSCYRQISPGEIFISEFFNHFKDEIKKDQCIIDFGCGTGRVCLEFLKHQLKPFLVDISEHCLDPGVKGKVPFYCTCLTDLPKELPVAEWIYCCDVLEHIDRADLRRVLEQMASKMKKGGFFAICLKEDEAGKHLGFPLHLTVESASWWKSLIGEFFHIEKSLVALDGLYLHCYTQMNSKVGALTKPAPQI